MLLDTSGHHRQLLRICYSLKMFKDELLALFAKTLNYHIKRDFLNLTSYLLIIGLIILIWCFSLSVCTV